jgi:hypothetical protein
VDNPSYFEEGDNILAEKVACADAVSFCSNLNKLYSDSLPFGYHYTLPT